MLIRIVSEDSESKLIESLEAASQKTAGRGFLQCCFSMIDLNPLADEVLILVKEHLTDKNAAIYCCEDGDIIIEWTGMIKNTLEAMIRTLTQKYGGKIPPDDLSRFFCFYDVHQQGEDLRLECRKKIRTAGGDVDKKNNTDASKDESKPPGKSKNSILPPELDIDRLNAHQDGDDTIPEITLEDFDEELESRLRDKVISRMNRQNIEILIVEDQLFSQKLLLSALSRDHTCHVAKNASEAIFLYAVNAPNIVLLDIELPGMNGHKLASLFRRVDKNAYIVMVTAHHYQRDVEKAKENQVKGFIVKPYTKQKIWDAITKYQTYRSKNRMKID